MRHRRSLPRRRALILGIRRGRAPQRRRARRQCAHGYNRWAWSTRRIPRRPRGFDLLLGPRSWRAAPWFGCPRPGGGDARGACAPQVCFPCLGSVSVGRAAQAAPRPVLASQSLGVWVPFFNSVSRIRRRRRWTRSNLGEDGSGQMAVGQLQWMAQGESQLAPGKASLDDRNSRACMQCHVRVQPQIRFVS